MTENSRNERTTISRVRTPREIGEFWDSHSLTDFPDSTREVFLEVNSERTHGNVPKHSVSNQETMQFASKTMKDKYCRICWNTEKWQRPTGDAAKIESSGSYVATHRFGHEEWLFNFECLIDSFRYSHLQPLGKYYNKYKGKSCSILLYSVTPEKETLLIARIRNVYIPEENELGSVLQEYKKRGWLDDMRTDVEAIGGDPTVLEDPDPVEIANVRFRPEDVTIFDPRPRVTGNHRISRKPKFYHPFDWHGKLPESETDPPPYDNVDPTRSDRERTRAAQEGGHVDPRHTRLQNRLYKHLCERYGRSRVLYEKNYVDLTLHDENGCTFFEIKMDPTVRRCIRSALGQLLEYAHYPEENRAGRLIVVGDVPPSDDDRVYVSLLREKYRLPIYYSRFHRETNVLEKEI